MIDPARHCQCCGELRPEAELVHLAVDRGFEIDEPPGQVFTHVWYCPDKPECVLRKNQLTTTGDPWAGVRDPESPHFAGETPLVS